MHYLDIRLYTLHIIVTYTKDAENKTPKCAVKTPLERAVSHRMRSR